MCIYDRNVIWAECMCRGVDPVVHMVRRTGPHSGGAGSAADAPGRPEVVHNTAEELRQNTPPVSSTRHATTQLIDRAGVWKDPDVEGVHERVRR